MSSSSLPAPGRPSPRSKASTAKMSYMANDVLEGRAVVGRNVLIAGAGLVGLETADFLRERAGRKSTLIDMIPAINYGVLGVGTHLKARLDANDTRYILNASIIRFTEHGVVYRQGESEKTVEGFDSIIIAMGSRSYNPLEAELKDLDCEVYVIGMLRKPVRPTKRPKRLPPWHSASDRKKRFHCFEISFFMLIAALSCVSAYKKPYVFIFLSAICHREQAMTCLS